MFKRSKTKRSWSDEMDRDMDEHPEWFNDLPWDGFGEPPRRYMDMKDIVPDIHETEFVLVRKNSGGVFADGTTNHPPIDFTDSPSPLTARQAADLAFEVHKPDLRGACERDRLSWPCETAALAIMVIEALDAARAPDADPPSPLFTDEEIAGIRRSVKLGHGNGGGNAEWNARWLATLDAALAPAPARCVCGAEPPRRPWDEGAGDNPCRDGNGNFRDGHGYASSPAPAGLDAAWALRRVKQKLTWMGGAQGIQISYHQAMQAVEAVEDEYARAAVAPAGLDAACSAIWNGCRCARKPHGDDRHVWRNTLDGELVDPARYPAPAGLDVAIEAIRRVKASAIENGGRLTPGAILDVQTALNSLVATRPAEKEWDYDAQMWREKK